MADDLRIEVRSDELIVAVLDDHEVGRLRIAVGDGVWEMYSTHVLESHEGRGIAARLVRAALLEADRAGVRVAASCWFVDGYLDRHADEFGHLRQGRRAADAPDVCLIAPTVVDSQ